MVTVRYSTEKIMHGGQKVWAVNNHADRAQHGDDRHCCTHRTEVDALYAIIGHLEMELDHGPDGRP